MTRGVTSLSKYAAEARPRAYHYGPCPPWSVPKSCSQSGKSATLPKLSRPSSDAFLRKRDEGHRLCLGGNHV